MSKWEMWGGRERSGRGGGGSEEREGEKWEGRGREWGREIGEWEGMGFTGGVKGEDEGR